MEELETKVDVVKVNLERELPPIEKVDEQTYATDVRRYENSLIENKSGLPITFSELDEVSMRQLLNFVNHNFNEYTGRMTFGNIVESYMLSGAYPNSYLQAHSEHNIDYNDKNDINKEEYFFDNREYAKIEVAAYRNWSAKKLDEVMREYTTKKFGGLTDKELIEMSTRTGLTQAKTSKELMEWVKVGSKVFGIEKNVKAPQINVFVAGGGEQLAKTIVQSTQNKNFDLMPEMVVEHEKSK